MEQSKVKVCTKCESEKDLFSFPAKKTSKDGRASWCRACFKANWDVRYYENHQHYRNSHNTSRRKIREENARRVFDYLKQHTSLMCGEDDPIVLEFDHRGESDKIDNISTLVTHSFWERVGSEISKCDVLCANCHRRKTAAQFGYKRHTFVNA